MKRILILLYLAVNSTFSIAQTVLTVNGQSFISSISGSYTGYAVPKSTQTTFTFTNNLFNTVNASGYQLLAGDEVVSGSNNHLDGAVITGNRFLWNGTDPASTAHVLFTGYNKNVIIKYNYLYRPPYGIPRKSNGMTNTSGGIGYNILIDPFVGIVVKGMNNVNIFNNTFYSSKTSSDTWRGLIDIYTNTDNGLKAPSTGTKVFNNIFYSKHRILNIWIYETTCLTGFESDYNVFYCEDGEPLFRIAGTVLTFSQWQARGYDLHSVVLNPNFINTTELVPRVRLDRGTDLGASWQTGLSVNAVWGTTSPATTDQNGTWQVGARIYSASSVPVSSISVSGAGGSSTITSAKGTLQLSALVLPDNASDKNVTWTITNGTGQATISASGLITAVSNGTVTARATARDGSGVYGSFVVTISNQNIPVSGIIVTGAGGISTITSDNGTLQLSVAIIPSDATNKNVNWSITNGTGQAAISGTGLVTAVADGTVTARATASDGSGVNGTLTITISNQVVPVTGITVTGAGGATVITTDNGTLQLNTSILPDNATNKTVSWTITNGTGQATINTTGLVTAVSDGTVTARATANDGSGIYGTLVITIASQLKPVTSITVTGAGGATTITTDRGTLQLSALVLPADATNHTVSWSVANGTGAAGISSTGVVTAITNGTVTARATANDGTGISGTLNITISNQLVLISGISVAGEGGSTGIFNDSGTLQLTASVLPSNATNKTIIWSIEDGTGKAAINTSGLVSAVENGTVTAKASSTDGSGIYGTLVITISGQTVSITDITVTGEGGASTITADNSSLQLYAEVLPSNATNKSVLWSLSNITGAAIISTDGLVTALENGTVQAIATADDGSGVNGAIDISIDINNQNPYSVIVTTDEIRIIFYEDFVSCIADLYNFQGNHIMRKTVESETLVFNTSHITAGLYLIVLSRGELLAVEKVMVP